MEKTCINVNCRKPIPGTDLYDLGNPMVCEECMEKKRKTEDRLKDYNAQRQAERWEEKKMEAKAQISSEQHRMWLERVERNLCDSITYTLHLALSNNHTVDELFTALDTLRLEMSVKKAPPHFIENAVDAIVKAKDRETVEFIVDSWYANHHYDEEATARIEKLAESKLYGEGRKK